MDMNRSSTHMQDLLQILLVQVPCAQIAHFATEPDPREEVGRLLFEAGRLIAVTRQSATTNNADSNTVRAEADHLQERAEFFLTGKIECVTLSIKRMTLNEHPDDEDSRFAQERLRHELLAHLHTLESFTSMVQAICNYSLACQ